MRERNMARRGRASPGSADRQPAQPKPKGSDAAYLRSRDLPKLVPLWPEDLQTRNSSEHARLLAKLRRALRAERKRGLDGHWSYDLARHAQLLSAYRAEVAAYLKSATPTSRTRCSKRK